MNPDDYDEDGNNIVPCPICLDKYCPSEEDGKCPEEEDFIKAINNKNMKELYTAKLNGNDVWFVREKNNTIGHMFNSLKDAMLYFDGNEVSPFGIAVNNEVMTMGTPVGWLKEVTLLK